MAVLLIETPKTFPKWQGRWPSTRLLSLIANEVDDWLKMHHQAGKPFFMTVWLHEPHGPISTTRFFRYDESFDTKLKQYYGNITQIDEAVGAIVIPEKGRSHG